jgi:hypothetical protein
MTPAKHKRPRRRRAPAAARLQDKGFEYALDVRCAWGWGPGVDWLTPKEPGRYTLPARAEDVSEAIQPSDHNERYGVYVIKHTLPIEVSVHDSKNRNRNGARGASWSIASTQHCAEQQAYIPASSEATRASAVQSSPSWPRAIPVINRSRTTPTDGIGAAASSASASARRTSLSASGIVNPGL